MPAEDSRFDESPPPHLGRRRILAIAGLVFLAFAIYRIFGVYIVRSGHCDPAAAPAPETLQQIVLPSGDRVLAPRRTPEMLHAPPLRVMTYNIEGHAALIRGSHLSGIAAEIRERKPDIVGLEEVHRYTWQSRFGDQAAELARLTGMQMTFGRSFKALGGEFGNAVLTRGRILDHTLYALPSIGEPRSALRCDVEIDGRRVNFFVTHLTSWGRLHRGSRKEEIDCVIALAKSSPLPFVVVGDFNAGPDTPEIQEVRKSRDIQVVPPPDEPTHKLLNEAIDYVLADYGWEPLRKVVPHSGPSDHWPVVAELRWARSASERGVHER